MATSSISVIICSHNPRKDYLERVIAGLKVQSMERNNWELLLVDNASAVPLDCNWDLSWHPQGRQLREVRLGLTWARLAGIQEARGDVLIFLDDDNVADQYYLDKALSVFQREPRLGVAGAGRLEPEFEEPPATELAEYLRFLAIRTVSADQMKEDPALGPVPWGAGLCARKWVAREYAEQVLACPIRKRLDRSGDILVSGGDDEFSWVAQGLGLQHGIFRDLRVQHLIDRKRVQIEYLQRLIHGNGYSCAMLAVLHDLSRRNPFETPSLSEFLRLLIRFQIRPSLRELQRYTRYLLKSPLDRRLSQARSQGWEEGIGNYERIANERCQPGSS